MDIWKFYEQVDDLAKKCEKYGYQDFATKLKNAKASGCTSGEIIGEVGLVLKKFKNQKSGANLDLDVIRLMEFVERSLG